MNANAATTLRLRARSERWTFMPIEGPGIIRRASTRDLEEVLRVINRSNAEAYRSIIPEEHFREPVLTMAELLDHFGRMDFYVYQADQGVVGVSALEVEDGETGEIQWVYALPGHQRRGIGTALVRRLELEAREISLGRLRLFANEMAYWATGFYEKLGYRPTDRVERPWGFDVLMEKRLDL